jgi:hypothetical protein
VVAVSFLFCVRVRKKMVGVKKNREKWRGLLILI